MSLPISIIRLRIRNLSNKTTLPTEVIISRKVIKG
jgi:hypothetical protein